MQSTTHLVEKKDLEIQLHFWFLWNRFQKNGQTLWISQSWDDELEFISRGLKFAPPIKTACSRYVHAEDGRIRFPHGCYTQKTAGTQVCFKPSLRLSEQVKYGLSMPERPRPLQDVQRCFPTLHQRNFNPTSAWVALQRPLSRLCCLSTFWNPSPLMISDTVNLKFKAPRAITSCQNSLKNEDNCILVQLKQASVQILCLLTHERSFELKSCSLWEALILSSV